MKSKRRVMLRCRKCKYEFGTNLEASVNDFLKLDLIAMKETCPRCSHTDIYSKPDYFLQGT